MKGESNCNLIFVYGTLRNNASQDLSRILSRDASFAGEAFVKGRLFNLGSYPGMVLSNGPDEVVTGELYEIAPHRLRDVLDEIDTYEGCGPTDPTPHEYRREIVDVSTPDDATMKAWAYVLNRQTSGLERIVSGDYLKWKRSLESTSVA